MHPALQNFHPLVARWFHERFGAPTEPQLGGWPQIASGRDTLIAAKRQENETGLAREIFIGLSWICIASIGKI